MSTTRYLEAVEVSGTGLESKVRLPVETADGTLVGTGASGGAVEVRNESGSDMAANALVFVSGYSTTYSRNLVTLADADASGKQAELVLRNAIPTGANGLAYQTALSAATLNTNGVTTAGDPVYLSATAGTFSNTVPTGATTTVQIVGYAVVKSATVGQIQYDLRDLPTVGTNDLQAVAVTAAKVALVDTHILVGGASGAAADVALSGDATLANTGALSIAATKLAATSIGYTIASTGTNTLLAAAAATRYVVGTVYVTTVFADGDGAQPTFTIGEESGSATKFMAAAALTGKAAGTAVAFGGALTTGKKLEVYATAGTGSTETGAITVAAIAVG